MTKLRPMVISDHKLGEIASLLFNMKYCFVEPYEKEKTVLEDKGYLDYHMPSISSTLDKRLIELYTKYSVDIFVRKGITEEQLIQLFRDRGSEVKKYVKEYESEGKFTHNVLMTGTKIKGITTTDLYCASKFYSLTQFKDRKELRNAAKYFLKYHDNNEAIWRKSYELNKETRDNGFKRGK